MTPEYRWVLQDAARQELRATDAFGTKEEAESWMGAEWSALADEGAEYVVLTEDGKTLYRMGLGEA